MGVWPRKHFFFYLDKKLGRFEKYLPPSLSNYYFVTEVYNPQITPGFPPGNKNDKLEIIYFFGTAKNTSLPQKYTSQTKYFSY